MKRSVLITVATSGVAIAVIVFIALWNLPSIASPPAPAQTPPADPGNPGPYLVGAARQSFTRLSTTTGKPQPLDVRIWYPATPGTPPLAADELLAAPVDATPDLSGAPYPLVLFSHGTGGVPWGVTYLTTHLASHGFVVMAPAHYGSSIAADCPVPCSVSNPAARPLIVDSVTNRPDELIFLLEQAASWTGGDDSRFAGLMDAARAGVVGHSFGGHTVLHAAATEHRFRAVVASAPWGDPPGPPRLVEAIPRLVSPTMLVSGMLDDLVSHGQTRGLMERFGPSAPDRWLLTMPRAGHFAFINECPGGRAGCGPTGLPQDRAHALIKRWATAFLLRHVAADERFASFLDPALAADDPDLQITFTPARGSALRMP
jgi:predicted dienelactone hydrolase